MKQEEKELLLQDLCARLPYGVICDIYNAHCTIKERLLYSGISRFVDDTICVRPYLFPLSSMTEEQEIEYDATFETIVYEDGRKDSVMTYKSFDWLNKNRFDYRGLIPMGLAIDATGLNIY